MPSFFDKNGYDVEITVGPYFIDTTNPKKEYGLCDQLIISATSNNSRTAVFTFIPPETTVNLEDFQGAEVHIIIRTQEVGFEQAFFGYVDTPKLDFLSRKVTLECSDARSNRVIQLPPGVVSSIGSYSAAVFGTSKDQAEELEKRLQTVAGTFDFDRFGNYNLTPWLASTIQWTFNPDDVFYGENPTVEYTNRVKTINTINIEANYTYQRLHHQVVGVSWSGYSDFMRDYWNQGRPSFPAKQTIIGSAFGSDWKIVSNTANMFVDIWPAQGFANGGGFIIWQPNQVIPQYKGRTQFNGYLKTNDVPPVFITDGTGHLVPNYAPVIGSDGKQVMDKISETVTDTSSMLCRGASWAAALRFAQSVTEKFTIQLRSPQSIAKYGVIDSFERVDITDPYDVSLWEGSDTINMVSDNFYVNQKNNYGQILSALQVSLNKARHDILDLHRDVVMSFRCVGLKPYIDLSNMIDVTVDQSAIGSTAKIRAKGRVSTLQHVIDFDTLEAYTRMSIRLSRAQGSASNSNWSVPVPAEDPNYIYNTIRSIQLGTHLGIDPDPTHTPGAETWTGWIGNREVNTSSGNNTSSARTTFQETFIVDYPKIPDIIRNDITYYSDALFDLSIPNDYLEVSF